jgi:hypothetical protein
MQDPKNEKELVLYQMVALLPLGLVPSLIYIYLKMNSDKKENLIKRIELLEQSNRGLRAGAANTGPASIV